MLTFLLVYEAIGLLGFLFSWKCNRDRSEHPIMYLIGCMTIGPLLWLVSWTIEISIKVFIE